MNHPRRQMEDNDVQEALSPPPQALHMPQRKGSDNVLCLGLLDSMSSHHQQTSLSTGSPVGLDLEDEESNDFDDETNICRRSSNLIHHHKNKCEYADKHNNTYNHGPPKRPDLPWEPRKPEQGEIYNEESSVDGNGDVEEPLNDDSCGDSEAGGQEKELDRPPRTPQNEREDPSSSSFDDMVQGFHIVDLKWQTDCLNSPLKDGSNATGDDPPTYPTHPTTRYGDDDDHDEEDTTYRDGEEEEIPLRPCDGGGAGGSKSGNNRAYRKRPGCITTRPPSISNSNSVSSNLSSPQPYYAKQALITTGTGTSVVSGASCGCGGRVACEDGSTAQESQSTTFLLTEERVRAFMVDYYEDFDSIGQSSECLETFFHHYCTPEIRWMRPSGNPISLDGLVRLFQEDLQVEKCLLVSVDSIQILAGGLAAIVTVTADQIFRYRGTPNSDRAVISHVLEVVNNGREIKIVHEHRTTGRPIPKESRWSTTES